MRFIRFNFVCGLLAAKENRRTFLRRPVYERYLGKTFYEQETLAAWPCVGRGCLRFAVGVTDFGVGVR